MKDKIAFVAIGQAGGNIGQLFEERGFSVLYLNTSEEDLSTLEDAKFKYHITGGEGCNKDRRKAKQLVIDDYDSIATEMDAKIKADIIFVVFASGGGTGSGAGPMLCDLLIDDGKTVGAVTVLPALDESIKSHVNAYECFSELTKIDGLSACFILDNENGNKLDLNKEFVEDFTAFVEIPDKIQSVEGNIDKAEIQETLKAHGMAVVLQSSPDSADVIKKIQSNVFAPIEPDRVVKYITAAMSSEARMADIEKALGVPVDTFQTLSSGTVLCASGLSFPQTRLDLIYERIDENRETIKKNLKATHELTMKEDIDFLSEPRASEKKDVEKKPQSRRSIMTKYL
jgi:cell division GTPase FtsZ